MKLSPLFYILLIFCTCLEELASGRICIHGLLKNNISVGSSYRGNVEDEKNPTKVFDGLLKSNNKRKGWKDEWVDLKIWPIYLFTSDDYANNHIRLENPLPPTRLSELLSDRRNRKLVTNVLDTALRYLSEMLKVREDKLDLEILKSGLQVGHVLYATEFISIDPDENLMKELAKQQLTVLVTTIPIEQQGVEAYSMVILDGVVDNRPMLGWVNIGEDVLIGLMKRDEINVGVALNLFLHELTHLLGFSIDYFTARGIVQSMNILDDSTKVRSKVNWITSNRVVEFVRNHFDCPNLKGAFLEDLKLEGTQSSHWEKSMYLDEYMIGDSNIGSSVTKLTISVLEDLGWYKYVGGKLDPLIWGAKKGCAMASTFGCGSWPLDYHCKFDSIGCSKTLNGYGPCAEDSPPYMIGKGCRYYHTFYLCGYSLATSSPTANKRICLESYVPGAYEITYSVQCQSVQCSSDGKILITRDDGKSFSCESLNRNPNKDIGYIRCPEGQEVICFNQEIDSFWPRLISVSPDEAPPSARVIINGFGILPDGTLNIGGPCEYIEPADEDKHVYSLPSEDIWKKNFIRHKRFDVIYTDTKNRSNVLTQALKPQLEFATLEKAQWWVEDHTILVVVLGLVVIVATALLVKHCFG